MTTATATETATKTSNPVGRPRTKISPKQLDQAATLYNKGWSVQRIVMSKKAGKKTAKAWADVEVANLYHHLRQRDDVEMRGKGRQGLTEEQKALIVESYESGMTMGKIQSLSALVRRRKVDGEEKRIKFSLPTLAKCLHEAGVEVRRGRPAKAKPEAEAEE